MKVNDHHSFFSASSSKYSLNGPGACFSKVPKLFGPILGTTIPFISSQRRSSKPSNFAILLIFLILKACKKISFSKRADCSLTTSFSGPKSSRDVRETGPRGPENFFWVHFEWNNSLCIFRTEASQGTKLYSCFHFYSLYNIWKGQLYRIGCSEFQEWLFGPGKFSELSRNGSWTGIRNLTSAIPMQCSISWAIRPTWEPVVLWVDYKMMNIDLHIWGK